MGLWSLIRSISIHAPRVGCDWTDGEYYAITAEFQSTHPVWGATGVDLEDTAVLGVFQSTHPVWGATLSRSPRPNLRGISIHAPRVGCDPPKSSGLPRRNSNFNPRTPCGVRPSIGPRICTVSVFQSTHPVWGATAGSIQSIMAHGHFNPRTPCGVRPEQSPGQRGGQHNFNPRTPCGVRRHRHPGRCGFCRFQSTHPVWGATS